MVLNFHLAALLSLAGVGSGLRLLGIGLGFTILLHPAGPSHSWSSANSLTAIFWPQLTRSPFLSFQFKSLGYLRLFLIPCCLLPCHHLLVNQRAEKIEPSQPFPLLFQEARDCRFDAAHLLLRADGHLTHSLFVFCDETISFFWIAIQTLTDYRGPCSLDTRLECMVFARAVSFWYSSLRCVDLVLVRFDVDIYIARLAQSRTICASTVAPWLVGWLTMLAFLFVPSHRFNIMKEFDLPPRLVFGVHGGGLLARVLREWLELLRRLSCFELLDMMIKVSFIFRTFLL